jgi:outer membrane receptor protein involved in Fe transport
LLLALAAPASAQESTTGSIGGRVTDQQGLPLPGVNVSVNSERGDRTAVTDAEGRFFVPFLTPGSYDVRAELAGFRVTEQRDVQVRLGQRAEVPLQLSVGGVSETVQVTGGTQVVDTTSTTAGVNLDSDTLARLPVGRRFSDTLYVATGVSSGGGTGRANPSISGSSGLENQYIVDGVDITNPGYGALGSYSIVFGSLGTGVTYDFIQEVQVKTAGFEAEYGQATGGVVNVVTKSGSNNLRGTAFTYWRPEALEGDYAQVETINATRPEAVNFTGSQVSDAGIEIGGPVLTDRLFFFGAIDPQWERTSLIAPEGFPLRDLGEVDRKRHIIAYAAKGTYQVTPGHRLDASFFGDPAEGEMGPQRRTALTRTDTAGFSEIAYGGHNQTVQWNATLSPYWLVEASFARAYNNIEETPSVNEWFVTNRLVTPNVRSGGIGFYEVGNEGETLQYQLKSTNIVNFFGNHQLRYGVSYEDIDYSNIIDRTGPSFTLPDGVMTATGAEINVLPDPTFGQIYSVSRANLTNIRETGQQYLAFFVQDVWRVGDRLTVRPGIRYEQQKLVGNLTDVTWDGNWAPRLGVVFDPQGQGRMKVYANWGRFYAQIPNDLAARALSADAGVTRADYFDAALTQPVPEGVLAAGQTDHFILAGLSAADIDPDSGSTYLNEFLTGFEWEAAQGLNLGVRYTHRNFGRVLEDIGTLPMVAYFLPDVEGADSVEYFITNPDANTPVAPTGLGATFEDPIHDYDALEFLANKRFGDRWALQSSYRWSRLEGNFEGFFRNDNGQSDPAITSLFDFPTNDPSYTAIGVPAYGFRGDIRFLGERGAGPLPNDRTHQAKVFGSYLFPFGLNVGVGATASSGQPLTALAANPAYRSAGEIPETPRGDGFETVDGFRDRTPTEVQFDVHLDYAIPIYGQRLTLVADVFNLFDRQEALEYDNYTESTFGVLNPDFGRIITYQTPRQVRIGARLAF